MRKQILALILFLILIISAGYAQKGIGGSITGAGQLNEDQIELQKLEKLAASGVSHPDLFYNIGVCHSELGRPGLATLYYLKALALDSAHPQARHNLRLLQELNPSSVQPSRLFLIQLLYDVFAWLNYDRLALLILISLFLTVLCAHWLLHYPPEAEKGPPVLLLSLCALLLLFFSASLIIKRHRSARDNRAVVTIPLATSYSDPRGERASGPLPEASIIRITGEQNGFWQARLDNGSYIWIKRGDVTRLLEM